VTLYAKMLDANRQGGKESMEVDATEEYNEKGSCLLLVCIAMLRCGKGRDVKIVLRSTGGDLRLTD